jgi:hypothetical protein
MCTHHTRIHAKGILMAGRESRTDPGARASSAPQQGRLEADGGLDEVHERWVEWWAAQYCATDRAAQLPPCC